MVADYHYRVASWQTVVAAAGDQLLQDPRQDQLLLVLPPKVMVLVTVAGRL